MGNWELRWTGSHIGFCNSWLGLPLQCFAALIVWHLFVYYGCPTRLYTDQLLSLVSSKSLHFESSVIKELCKLYATLNSHTTPYHPQGNTQCERFNWTMHNMLHSLLTNNWKEHFSTIIHVHSSTSYAPSYLLFERDVLSDKDAESNSVENLRWLGLGTSWATGGCHEDGQNHSWGCITPT